MHVTIVGGGFGGVKAALEIAKNPKNRVTLITDKPDFQYYPTLYSSATGHSYRESWAPLGEIFGDHKNVDVHIDEITHLDADQRIVSGASKTDYHYDHLILALGVVTTYFNIEGLETYAYGIKSEAEIRRLKHRFYIDIAENHTFDKNYVIVGAGPTGVELAAALCTYLRRLAEHYEMRSHRVSVRLVEAAPRVLPRSAPAVSKRVEKRLKSLGVKVETNKKVEEATATELIVSGKPVTSHTVIWTSGVANHPFFAKHPDVFRFAPNNRVVVDAHLEAAKDIYVIGDNAATPFTGLAQTAIHDARFVARNLDRKARRKSLAGYKAVRPIQAIPVGANWAVIEWGWFRLYGYVASLIRRAADLFGYSEVFPLGTSLSSWHAAKIHESDYFTPSPEVKKRR
jgi:NADH dehydrogenase